MYNKNASLINVTYFQRLPAPGQISIERLFDEVRRHLPSTIQYRIAVNPRPSRGFTGRLINVVSAARHQGQVNHITGDVHYLTMGLSGGRTLLTIHDCVMLERLKGVKREILRWFWYTIPIRQATLVSVISESTRTELLRHVDCDPSKIRVIPNCLIGNYSRSDKPFKIQNPIILQVGTSQNKNIERVAEAIAGLPCHFKIIGGLTPAQREALAKFNIEFSNIESASDAQLRDSYETCDLLVFASTYEGFGLPIIEANAIGRPVITSNLLSMPEVAGAAACFVDPFNPESIRAGIDRVIRDRSYRESILLSGFDNVKRFDPNVIARHYADLYQELAFN